MAAAALSTFAHDGRGLFDVRPASRAWLARVAAAQVFDRWEVALDSDGDLDQAHPAVPAVAPTDLVLGVPERLPEPLNLAGVSAWPTSALPEPVRPPAALSVAALVGCPHGPTVTGADAPGPHLLNPS